jgi:hypothetical protein
VLPEPAGLSLEELSGADDVVVAKAEQVIAAAGVVAEAEQAIRKQDEVAS